jgi:hypothetical protein
MRNKDNTEPPRDRGSGCREENARKEERKRKITALLYCVGIGGIVVLV